MRVIGDLALRWVVTALFAASAAVSLRFIVAGPRSATAVIGHALHAVMAVAMAVMAWPRGADLPTRAPMVFFALAAVWFTGVALRSKADRGGSAYHAVMMLAMSWMYAAMGGLPLRRADAADSMDMPSGTGHGGHGGHAGHAGHGGASSSPDVVGILNWACTLGFAAAAAYWLFRALVIRQRDPHDTALPGALSQVAMAAGMAIMFAVML